MFIHICEQLTVANDSGIREEDVQSAIRRESMVNHLFHGFLIRCIELVCMNLYAGV
jgi:hypothetical protein